MNLRDCKRRFGKITTIGCCQSHKFKKHNSASASRNICAKLRFVSKFQICFKVSPLLSVLTNRRRVIISIRVLTMCCYLHTKAFIAPLSFIRNQRMNIFFVAILFLLGKHNLVVSSQTDLIVETGKSETIDCLKNVDHASCRRNLASVRRAKTQPVYTPPTSKPVYTPPTSKPVYTPPSSKPTSIYNAPSTSTPTSKPTSEIGVLPTDPPTLKPTKEPTVAPSAKPTPPPSKPPTPAPTPAPTPNPTAQPTYLPTSEPTPPPTPSPTRTPTNQPTFYPTATPTCLITVSLLSRRCH